MLTVERMLEWHAKGQHPTTVTLQPDAYLYRGIQSHHGVMQHGGNEMSQCRTGKHIGRVVIT